MSNFRQGPFDPRAARFQALAGRVDAALKSNDIAAAIDGAQVAIAEGHAHPAFFNILAAHEMQRGRYSEALDQLRKGLKLAPRDPNLLNMAGVAHNNLREYREAVRAFDSAVSSGLAMPQAFYNRGTAFEALGELDRAHSDFERAVTLQPNFPEALSRLAYAEAVRGRLTAARSRAENALRLNPRDPLSQIVLAMADNADGQFSFTITRLTALLPALASGPVNRALALGLLGDAYDGAGDTEMAFDAYTASAAVLQQLYALQFARDDAYAQAQMLLDYFSHVAWRADFAVPADPHVAGHVFLVGFPRSGTTLLEQTLAGNANVVTSEERSLLGDTVIDFVGSLAGLDRFAALEQPALQRLRDAYWTAARQAGLKFNGKVFIDKLPLNTVLLPVIARLFPRAKILFALRDPRDVVFSCFRRSFGMSAQMYQFVTLDGAARYYDIVMRASERYRDLGLAWRDVRHEDLVRDYEAQARDICGWLGLAWDAEMVRVAERLSTRAVNTPSTLQIVKGVNTKAFAAWRRYAPQMKDVLQTLEPWVRRFGYGETA